MKFATGQIRKCSNLSTVSLTVRFRGTFHRRSTKIINLSGRVRSWAPVSVFTRSDHETESVRLPCSRVCGRLQYRAASGAHLCAVGLSPKKPDAPPKNKLGSCDGNKVKFRGPLRRRAGRTRD